MLRRYFSDRLFFCSRNADVTIQKAALVTTGLSRAISENVSTLPA